MKINKFAASIARLLFVTQLLSPAIANAATPVINNVDGRLQPGQTLIITGIHLVNEDKTKWIPLFKTGTAYGFEGTSYLADRYHIAPDANRFEPTYDNTVKIQGDKSYKARIYGKFSGGHYTNNASSGAYVDVSEAGAVVKSDLYVRLYSMWNSAGTKSVWPVSHIKMLDFCCSGNQQWYFQPNVTNGDILPTQMNMVYNGTNHNFGVSNFLQNKRWYCMEVRWKTSPPYIFMAWVDGVQIASASPNSSGDPNYIMFGIINLQGTGNDFDLTNWIDALAISTSRIGCATKVEIGNNSNYAAATKTTQEVLYFSDSSVRIKISLAGLGAGPYYLWITNNRQERSSAYLLQINFK